MVASEEALENGECVMASSVTIADYDLSVHARYAKDIANLERQYIEGAEQIPAHIEVIRTKEAISSKWDDLFKTSANITPFANFSPPPLWEKTRNRFFSHVLSNKFDWADEQEEEEQEEQNKKEKNFIRAMKELIREKESALTPFALFERDRESILALLDSIELLNGYLRHIMARRLQYQKG